MNLLRRFCDVQPDPFVRIEAFLSGFALALWTIVVLMWLKIIIIL